MKKRMIIIEPKEPSEPIKNMVRAMGLGIIMAIVMTPVIFLFYAFLDAAWDFGKFLHGLMF